MIGEDGASMVAAIAAFAILAILTMASVWFTFKRRWPAGMRARVPQIVLWLGIVLTVAMGIYPPWQREYQGENFHAAAGSESYDWIFRDRSGVSDNFVLIAHIDAGRLFLQWAMVWLVVGPLLWTLRGRANAPIVISAGDGKCYKFPNEKAAQGFERDAAKTGSTTTRVNEGWAYRQSLLRAVGHDEDKVNRLVQYERNQKPGATLEQLHEAAYERWIRDNR